MSSSVLDQESDSDVDQEVYRKTSPIAKRPGDDRRSPASSPSLSSSSRRCRSPDESRSRRSSSSSNTHRVSAVVGPYSRSRMTLETADRLARFDSDSDMDDFIVDNDEEAGLTDEDGTGSGSERGPDWSSSFAVHRSLDSERDRKYFAATTEKYIDSNEAFPVYAMYLASCLMDPDFQKELGTEADTSDDAGYFLPAVRKIDGDLQFRKQQLVTSSAWRPSVIGNAELLPFISYDEVQSSADCEVCGRAGHPSSYRITLEGIPYRPEFLLEKDRWFLPNGKKWVTTKFRAGRFCFARMFLWHSMHHFRFYAMREIWRKLLQTAQERQTLAAVRHGAPASLLADPQEILTAVCQDSLFIRKLLRFYNRLMDCAEQYNAESMFSLLSDAGNLELLPEEFDHEGGSLPQALLRPTSLQDEEIDRRTSELLGLSQAVSDEGKENGVEVGSGDGGSEDGAASPPDSKRRRTGRHSDRRSTTKSSHRKAADSRRAKGASPRSRQMAVGERRSRGPRRTVTWAKDGGSASGGRGAGSGTTVRGAAVLDVESD